MKNRRDSVSCRRFNSFGMVHCSMRLKTACILFAAALGFSLGAEAQTYTIQPGDSLRIIILNRPEYTQEVTVGPDGMLPYFLVGSIDTKGMTLEALQKRIAEGLSTHFSDPQAIVVPTPRSYGVYVGGQVANPGFHAAPEPEIDLRRAVILAGGPLPDSANLKNALLYRADGETAAYDLTQYGQPPLIVKNGDAVYIRSKARIQVSGNVQKPDIYYVDAPPTAAFALALAGGPMEDRAALDRLVILRSDGVSETIQLSEQFWNDDPETLPRLQSGDALFVPYAYAAEEISVIGYVRAPGLYKVRGPIPVGRALALSGGADAAKADMNSAEIQRLDGSWEKADLRTEAAGVLVYPGETVRVRKRFQVNWSFVLSAITTGALLVRLIQNN